jgi:hypothetical protein
MLAISAMRSLLVISDGVFVLVRMVFSLLIVPNKAGTGLL